MLKFKIAALLQLFAEGGDGTGDSPAAGGITGDKIATAAAGQEDLDADFARLVGKNGKYADAFQKQMQKSFNKRFASFKETEAKAQRLDDFRKTVAMRYSDVNADDLDALEKAFISDARFNDTRASKAGEDAKVLAEQDKKDMLLKKLEAADRTEIQRRMTEAVARKFYDRIVRQEKDMKSKYKEFDLADEIKNPKFKKALFDPENTLEDAYWLVHRAQLTKKAIEDTRAATVNSIAARGARPAEGAASSAVPSTSKVDIQNMSDGDFMELYNKMFRT